MTFMNDAGQVRRDYFLIPVPKTTGVGFVPALLFLVGLATMTGCAVTNSSTVVVEGRLRPAGMTSFMYGTHLLVNSNGSILYAVRGSDQTLESSLESFHDRVVRMEGRKVEGYPIEGGPPLLEVTRIRAVPSSGGER